MSISNIRKQYHNLKGKKKDTASRMIINTYDLNIRKMKEKNKVINSDKKYINVRPG